MSLTSKLTLIDLPHELIELIIHTAIDHAPIPSNILRVSRLFHDVGYERLYTHLWFTSSKQLRLFALSSADFESPERLDSQTTRPGLALVVPRSLKVDLKGKREMDVFRHLHDTLVKCQRIALAWAQSGNVAHEIGAATGSGVGIGDLDVRLRCLRLRMHSYSRDTAIELLAEGLRAVSPDVFEWTGPDPDHHFSTAIIAPVASCLLEQFTSWKNIREIKVTNISFAIGSESPRDGPFPSLIEDVPSLRSLYIGQATFLKAQAVAGMFCQGRMPRMEELRLVDAYSESIWGPRLRRSDVERAALSACHTDELEAVIARIKRVVVCQKKTERIMGGDRVEGTYILN